MIAINLLPEASRKPQAASWQQFPRSPLALLLSGALVGVSALLLLIQGVEQAQLARLSAQIKQLETRKQAVDQLKQSVDALRSQQAVYRRLDRARSRWARHLNVLSDVTPDGVWFTDLSVDAAKGFTLAGRAIVHGGEEMVRIGQLVKDLKTDPGFSETVRDIQIEEIKRVQDGEIELVEFTILGTLVPPAQAQP